MHGHHTDIFVYCLYDTVLKYFDFGKRVLSEERQTRPAHSCGQFQVFPCHTPLDQTHPPCCMFRFVGESLISSGDDSLWRLMQHPFQYTMMHKKAYREPPIYIYTISQKLLLYAVILCFLSIIVLKCFGVIRRITPPNWTWFKRPEQAKCKSSYRQW